MLVRGLAHKRFVDVRIEALTLGADRTQAFLCKETSASWSRSKSGGPHKPCQLGPALRYHKSVALSYHNATTTPCLSLSVPVPLEELNSDKSAVLSPRVPPCRPLSLSRSGYESEGRRFESCRARPGKSCKLRDSLVYLRPLI